MIFNVNITLDDGACIPTKANYSDAGYDLYAIGDRLIAAGGSAIIDTGVHMELPVGYYGDIRGRSGLNFKYDVTVPNGTVDSGYRGSIKVKLYNNGPHPYQIHDGDKIAQMVITSYESPTLNVKTTLSESDRGENGFGSTGR